MAKTDAFNLKRLKEEQEKALIQTDDQLEQWNRFRSDYVALRDRLKTLPNKTTHNVMVPFGSLAFMPGQLVHTNEILVLLGDNYFVERSAVQAADIVTRRLKKLDENIQDLQKEREMLTPRAQFTSEMFQMASGGGEQQEIREEFDEEQEHHWRERHREYIRRAGEREMKEKAEKEDEKGRKAAKTDMDYWDILDQLEQQENARQELENLEEEEELQAQQQSEHEQSELAWDADHFAEDEECSSSLDESEETDREEEEDSSTKEEEEEFERSRQKIITFSHTKQQADTTSRDPAVESGKDDTDMVINSPADLYRLVKTAPKSILKTPSKGIIVSHSQVVRRCSSQEEPEKKVTFGREQLEGGRNARGVNVSFGEKSKAGDRFAESEETSSVPGKLSCTPRVQAFTDMVVERQTTTGHSQQPRNDSSTSQVSQPVSTSSSRPVSKFRAARQKTDIVSGGSQGHLMDSCDSSAAASRGGGDVSSARPVSKFRASRMKQGGES